MKSLLIISLLTIMAFLLLPAMTFAQTYQAAGNGPQLAQPLVREGTLAVTLAGALQLGQTTGEVDAESLLSAAGIAPRNGWVADYPVTPDIAGELRAATAAAAADGSLSMAEDEALTAYDGVMSRYNLSVRAGAPGETESGPAPTYPDSAAADNYYYDYGPPVVTYYAPPVDYAYLYTWVPYPFWWWSVWFPGFFVLADFDVPVFVGGRACFVTNHFFDRDDHRFFRVNAFDRFHSARFADRRAVFGPSVVTAAARTTFRHSWAGGDRSGFATTANGTIVQRPERNTVMRSSSGSPSFVPGGHGVVANREVRRGRLNRSSGTFAPSSRSYSASAPRQVSPSFSGGRPFEGFRGRGSFSGVRNYAPSSRSYSAPAPRQVSPSMSTGRAFEGFRGGSFGGMRGR